MSRYLIFAHFRLKESKDDEGFDDRLNYESLQHCLSCLTAGPSAKESTPRSLASVEGICLQPLLAVALDQPVAVAKGVATLSSMRRALAFGSRRDTASHLVNWTLQALQAFLSCNWVSFFAKFESPKPDWPGSRESRALFTFRVLLGEGVPLMRRSALLVMDKAFSNKELIPVSEITRLLRMPSEAATLGICRAVGLSIEPRGSSEGPPNCVRFHAKESFAGTAALDIFRDAPKDQLLLRALSRRVASDEAAEAEVPGVFLTLDEAGRAEAPEVEAPGSLLSSLTAALFTTSPHNAGVQATDK